MKKIILVISMFTFSVAALAIAENTTTTHPVEMDGQDCLTCHMDAEQTNIDVYNQWQDSMHGLTNVRCVTCHGDDTSFQADSSINTCLSCHPQEASTINKTVEDKGEGLICSSCHAVHSFTVTKEAKPVHTK